MKIKSFMKKWYVIIGIFTATNMQSDDSITSANGLVMSPILSSQQQNQNNALQSISQNSMQFEPHQLVVTPPEITQSTQPKTNNNDINEPADEDFYDAQQGELTFNEKVAEFRKQYPAQDSYSGASEKLDQKLVKITDALAVDYGHSLLFGVMPSRYATDLKQYNTVQQQRKQAKETQQININRQNRTYRTGILENKPKENTQSSEIAIANISNINQNKQTNTAAENFTIAAPEALNIAQPLPNKLALTQKNSFNKIYAPTSSENLLFNNNPQIIALAKQQQAQTKTSYAPESSLVEVI